MSLKFQWSFGDLWINCTPQNNAIFTERRKTPQMAPLCLTNDYGTISGVLGNLKFCIHEDDDIVTCDIRQAPKVDELPIYAIVNTNGPFVLDYATSRALFNDNGTVRTSTERVQYGTETFQTVESVLFQVVTDQLFPKRHRPVDITEGHFEDMTRARFRWKFQGPLRWNRMTRAVQTVFANTEDEEQRSELQEIFDSFNPSEDNTEYGPFQFPDYLNSLGMVDVAFQVVEEFKKIPDSAWSYFDPITNTRIEEARRQERPVVVLEAEGQKYMIVFDIGTGASGNSAVMIRPTRYQKIIESIEEQFHEAAEEQHKRILHELFTLLSSNNIDPKQFVMAMVIDEQHALNRLISNPELRTRTQVILQQLHASDGNLSTRMQQFMPTLLEKFKECEIKMDDHENLNPTQLCPQIAETLQEGLSIPASLECNTLKEMVQFIQREQCWQLPKGRNRCDICGQSGLRTLTHCGTASACLKCWADSLVKTNMSCPFCRGTIGEGDLKIASHRPGSPVKKNTGKRKRESYQSLEDILKEIHKDARYTNISMDTHEPMQKWFTILLRRKLVRIGQMPRNGQRKQDFKEAMKLFKLVS